MLWMRWLLNCESLVVCHSVFLCRTTFTRSLLRKSGKGKSEEKMHDTCMMYP